MRVETEVLTCFPFMYCRGEKRLYNMVTEGWISSNLLVIDSECGSIVVLTDPKYYRQVCLPQICLGANGLACLGLHLSVFCFNPLRRAD